MILNPSVDSRHLPLTKGRIGFSPPLVKGGVGVDLILSYN